MQNNNNEKGSAGHYYEWHALSHSGLSMCALCSECICCLVICEVEQRRRREKCSIPSFYLLKQLFGTKKKVKWSEVKSEQYRLQWYHDFAASLSLSYFVLEFLLECIERLNCIHSYGMVFIWWICTPVAIVYVFALIRLNFKTIAIDTREPNRKPFSKRFALFECPKAISVLILFSFRRKDFKRFVWVCKSVKKIYPVWCSLIQFIHA